MTTTKAPVCTAVAESIGAYTNERRTEPLRQRSRPRHQAQGKGRVMTPLISEFAKITADAETWHWFDTGNAPEIVEAAFDAELFALPYPRTAFVGVDTDGSKFCVALIAGENHVAVAGRYDTGSFAAYIEPFSYLNTDEGLRIYGGNGKEPPPRAHYMPVIALITRFVQSLRKPAIAYVPTAKKISYQLNAGSERQGADTV